jgi:hypothetical protein
MYSIVCSLSFGSSLKRRESGILLQPPLPVNKSLSALQLVSTLQPSASAFSTLRPSGFAFSISAFLRADKLKAAWWSRAAC